MTFPLFNFFFVQLHFTMNHEEKLEEIKDKLKELLSTKPELKEKVIEKIKNSELIEDREAIERLLSFIEE